MIKLNEMKWNQLSLSNGNEVNKITIIFMVMIA